MNPPTLKAFILCDNVTDNSASKDQKDLQGAGRSRFDGAGPLPVRLSFWVFVQLSDKKATGEVRLAIMRGDSGRRYFFRPVIVRHKERCKRPFSAFGCTIAFSLNRAFTSLNCGTMTRG